MSLFSRPAPGQAADGSPAAAATRTWTVALLGNPNTGKSTLFSALAGIHQRVANYPGVTVEKKTGRMEHAGRRYELIDLPGLYSLSPRSRDEVVAVDVLLGREPGTQPVDLVLCVVDASNLERNLYLVSQALERGLPVVVALNMLDVAESQGTTVDVPALAAALGVPVVATRAHRRQGIADLKAALDRLTRVPPAARPSPLPADVQTACRELAGLLPADSARGPAEAAFLAQRLLLDPEGHWQKAFSAAGARDLAAAVREARVRLAAAGIRLDVLETSARYDWSRPIVARVTRRSGTVRNSSSDKLDGLLTHRFWGSLILALVMLVLFQAVFSWAEPAMKLIAQGVQWTGGQVQARMPEGALRSLLVDGVVRGVGGVLVFLPQIAILFFFIALLEDCGYLARAAYLMDRLMSRVGLSGKSFLPMLASFACAVPGVMAARVVENERDRLTTILVLPLLTCSARLPVYALLIAAFIPPRHYLGGLLNLQGLTLAGLYLLGIVTAVAVAWLLKRKLLRGAPAPFLLELPSYKRPSLRTAAYRVLERSLTFVRCAGTLILAVSVLIWAAIYYPHEPGGVAALRARAAALEARLAPAVAESPQRTADEQELAALRHSIADQQQRQSILGRMGQWIEPAVRPLGWDWRIGCAVIASFPAREVVVATLGVIFNSDASPARPDEPAENTLEAKLRQATWEGSDRPLFTTAVASSVLVFFALCAQCAATLAVIRRETNSWRWPAFTFAYMTALAYLAAMAVYQGATWLGWA